MGLAGYIMARSNSALKLPGYMSRSDASCSKIMPAAAPLSLSTSARPAAAGCETLIERTRKGMRPEAGARYADR
eukprot:2240742-Prymnesium_polylepis.1